MNIVSVVGGATLEATTERIAQTDDAASNTIAYSSCIYASADIASTE